jgi:ubiquitin C-terminal hydrolase
MGIKDDHTCGYCSEQTQFCDRCKSSQAKFKQLQLLKCPETLVIHLKRFNFIDQKKVSFTGNPIDTRYCYSDLVFPVDLVSSRVSCSRVGHDTVFIV